MYLLVGVAIHPFIGTFQLNLYSIYACLLKLLYILILYRKIYFIYIAQLYIKNKLVFFSYIIIYSYISSLNSIP